MNLLVVESPERDGMRTDCDRCDWAAPADPTIQHVLDHVMANPAHVVTIVQMVRSRVLMGELVHAEQLTLARPEANS